MIPLTSDELRAWNRLQIDEILKYKWLESEKAGHDIGESRAASEWIQRYAEAFREQMRGREPQS